MTTTARSTTPAPATIHPKHRPTGAENPPPRGAAVRILIPGRPQAKDRNHDGRLLDAAKTYLDAVRTAAQAAIPQPADGPVRLDVHVIYGTHQTLPIRAWPQASIPNGDVAPRLALKALTGTLVHHRGQFNPLTITRTLLDSRECQAQYGHPDGATILTWEEHESR